MFKKQKLNNISNLKVQILDNNHPEYKETVAFYTRDGKNEQRVCFIKRKKGASNSYYIEQTKKRLNELNQKGKLKKKHHFVKPLVIAGSAICAAGLCVGIVFAVKNSTTQKVKVTFDAGIGTFSDGSHVKTITVNKGTNLNQIPHECATIAYGATNYWYYDEEFDIPRFAIVPKTCTIKTWVTDKNKTIDENNGYANYTINGNVTLFADYSNDLTTTKSVAIGEIANAANAAIGYNPEAIDKVQTMVEVAYGWLDLAVNGYQALAIGEASYGAIKWMGRQSEAYDKICGSLNLAYSQIIAAPTDGRALGIGIAAGKATEGISRQPEADEKINGVMSIIYENINDSPSAATGYALGYIGGYATLAVATQPEAEGKIGTFYLNAIERLESADDIYEAFAICKTASYSVISTSYQPESYDLINYLANTAYAVFHNLPNDSSAEGISETSVEAVLASAISPRAEREGSYYTRVTQMIYSVVNQITSPQQAWALGHAGAGAIDGILFSGTLIAERILVQLGSDINQILNINK